MTDVTVPLWAPDQMLNKLLEVSPYTSTILHWTLTHQKFLLQSLFYLLLLLFSFPRPHV